MCWDSFRLGWGRGFFIRLVEQGRCENPSCYPAQPGPRMLQPDPHPFGDGQVALAPKPKASLAPKRIPSRFTTYHGFFPKSDGFPTIPGGYPYDGGPMTLINGHGKRTGPMCCLSRPNALSLASSRSRALQQQHATYLKLALLDAAPHLPAQSSGCGKGFWLKSYTEPARDSVCPTKFLARKVIPGLNTTTSCPSSLLGPR